MSPPSDPFGPATVHHQWFFAEVRSKIPDSLDSSLRIDRHEHKVAVTYVLSGQFSVDISGQNRKLEDRFCTVGSKDLPAGSVVSFGKAPSDQAEAYNPYFLHATIPRTARIFSANSVNSSGLSD